MMNVSNGFDVRGRALQDGELAAWLAEHSLGNRFGLAVLGKDPAYDSKAVALAIVAADGDGRYIDTAALTPDDEAALASWLADPGPPKAVHEAKLMMHALAGCGWTLRGVSSDTASAAYLLRPEQPSMALNDLLIHHMRCALPTETSERQGPSEQAVQALILRACAVLDLADVLDEELARIDSSSLLSRVELPVSRTLAEMETTGIAVDRAALTRIQNRLEDEMKVAVDGLLTSIVSDGRIHTTFQQTIGATGRIASSNPNLHNIPVHLDDGRHIRDAFVAGDGYVVLMTAGYQDLEARIVAHLCGDAGLIEAFNPGDHYVAGGAGDYLGGVLDDARRIGYVSTLLGRRRYLPELDSGDRQVRAAAEWAALTFVVEGSAADIIKVAMIHIGQAIKDAGLKSRMLLQVENELLFEVAGGERDTLAAHVREQMGRAYPLHVPLEVSVGYGPNWGAARR
jgi:DNA polymerase I